MSDILAAIQVLGTYEFASRKLGRWDKRLGRVPRSAKTWEDVFNDHPEFFTHDDDDQISLVWRRSFARDYDTVKKELVNPSRLKELKEEEQLTGKSRLSRQPLNQDQIEHLCNLAVNLHEREIQHRQENRWWFTAVVAITLAIISFYK